MDIGFEIYLPVDTDWSAFPFQVPMFEWVLKQLLQRMVCIFFLKANGTAFFITPRYPGCQFFRLEGAICRPGLFFAMAKLDNILEFVKNDALCF